MKIEAGQPLPVLPGCLEAQAWLVQRAVHGEFNLSNLRVIIQRNQFGPSVDVIRASLPCQDSRLPKNIFYISVLRFKYEKIAQLWFNEKAFNPD